MRWLLSISAVCAALELGCADGTTLAARPANDPSSPDAPEAQALTPAPSISAAPSAAPADTPPPAHHHHHGGTP